MESLVSGVNEECFLKPVFPYRTSEHLDKHKIKKCQCFIAPPSHTSCRQPSPIGLLHHCLLHPSGM